MAKETMRLEVVLNVTLYPDKNGWQGIGAGPEQPIGDVVRRVRELHPGRPFEIHRTGRE